MTGSRGTVLVTGATGNVGRELVNLLVADGMDVRTISRRPPVPPLRGVRHFSVGFADVAGIRTALKDVRQVFIAAPIPVIAEATANVCTAASEVGVEHVVLLASSIVELGGDDPYSRAHRSAEEAVAAGGLPATVLRPGTFTSNALAWADAITAGEPIRLPTPYAPQAPIDPLDIARVAAVALRGGPGRVAPICPLAGGEVISPAEQVQVLSEVIGRPLRYEEWTAADDDVLFATLTRPDVPWARGSDAVERITGAPASTFRDWAIRHRDHFDVAVTIPAGG